MAWITNLLRRFRRHRPALEIELDEELAHHLELKQRQFESQGMTPEEARTAARRSLGNATLWKTDTREVWRFTYLESLWNDIAYSLRLLRKDRMFTCVALLTLAIGIGANTAIFSLLNGLLWHPMPVEKPEQLVRLILTNLPPTNRQWVNGREVKAVEGRQFTYPMYQAFSKHQQVFSAMFGIAGGGGMQVDVNGVPHRERVTITSGSMFPMLGLQPEAGRLLSEQDDVSGAPTLVVISDELWTRLFARSPAAIGARISIESVPCTIIGVAPVGFRTVNTGGETDLWVAMNSLESIYPQFKWRENRSGWYIQPMARLRPGVTVEQANQHIAAIGRAVLEDSIDPELTGDAKKYFLAMKIESRPAPNGLPWNAEQYNSTLWILLAAVGAVLLIAVTNLTNLFLARAAARRHETALRLSLGAPAARIRRQLMLESGLIAIGGAAAGLLWARWLIAGFEAAVSQSNSAIVVDTTVDWRLFAFLASVLLTVVVVAGLVPAFSASRVAPQEALKKHSGGSRSLSFRRSLIVLQTALSLTLLGGAGLMLASLRELVEQPTGFQAENLVWMSPDLFNAGIGRDHIPEAYRTLLSAMREQPNIVAAAWTNRSPLSGSFANTTVQVEGRPDLSKSDRTVYFYDVTDGYFAAAGIPILAGADLPPAGSKRTDLCVVSANTAIRFFGSPQEAIGRRLKSGDTWREIIGVVGDARYQNIREAPPLTMYLPVGANPNPGMTMVVRYRGPLEAAASSLRYLAQKTAGRVPYMGIETVRANIDQSLSAERLLAWLLGGFAGFAVLISVIGIFGLLSYSVEQRRKELGIRIALGATPARIRRAVQTQGLVLTAAGLLAGLALSYALRKSLDSFLYGVASTNPLIWTIGLAALLLAGFAATALPASRAARVDPLTMLRDE
jgi:predicted permease